MRLTYTGRSTPSTTQLARALYQLRTAEWILSAPVRSYHNSRQQCRTNAGGVAASLPFCRIVRASTPPPSCRSGPVSKHGAQRPPNPYGLLGTGRRGGGRGYGGGEGRGRLYTYRYTVTSRMTSALRWAAMRAVLKFHNLLRGTKSRDSVHRPQLLKEKGEPKQIRTDVPLLSSLTPYR